MKILQINVSDRDGAGGGAIAAERLVRGLRRAGADCRVLCGRKTMPEDPRTAPVPRWRLLEALIRPVTRRLGLNDLHCVGSFGILRHPWFRRADLVHLHVLHSNYFNYLMLPRLSAAKPTVLTLHDCWPMTGHCGFGGRCRRWQHGCGRCPDLGTYPPVAVDNTRLEWILKNWAHGRSRLTVIAPSRWMAAEARLWLAGRFPVHHLPYGIDTQWYRPHDRTDCRRALGLPLDRLVLLTGAASLSSRRKGLDLLVQALQRLPAALAPTTVLATMGHGDAAAAAMFPLPVVPLGFIADEATRARVFSAADLFVMPTRADNLPLMLQEAMACGTPAVAFAVGGVGDLVRPGVTGELAAPEDPAALADALARLLGDLGRREALGRQARAVACAEYDLDRITERHLDLFTRTCARRRSPRRAPPP